MDFKAATDILWGTQPVTAADMAERLYNEFLKAQDANEAYTKAKKGAK